MKAPPREQQQSENEAEFAGEFCIRFMETALDGIHENETLKPHYGDLYQLLAEVSQHLLARYAFDYAYRLYSAEDVVRSRRLAFEIRESQKRTGVIRPRPR